MRKANESNGAESMKRRRASVSDGEGGRNSAQSTAKRPALGPKLPESIITARMPIKLLTTNWSLGFNQPLDPRHVQNLKKTFVELGGPKRELEEHHLKVLCTGAEVERVMKELDLPDDTKQVEGLPDFTIWPEVNGREPLQLLAGQHRIRALEEWAKDAKLGEEELWWPCKFYDRDSISLEQNLKLRVNSKDVAKPDSHGDIWLFVDMAIQNWKVLANLAGNKALCSKLSSASSRDKLAIYLLGELWGGNDESSPSRPTTGEAHEDAESTRCASAVPTRRDAGGHKDDCDPVWASDSPMTQQEPLSSHSVDIPPSGQMPKTVLEDRAAGTDAGGEDDGSGPGSENDFVMAKAKNKTALSTPSTAKEKTELSVPTQQAAQTTLTLSSQTRCHPQWMLGIKAVQKSLSSHSVDIPPSGQMPKTVLEDRAAGTDAGGEDD
ncbi:hypothetical protein E4U13_007085, partial [Claviceps humidiphila]